MKSPKANLFLVGAMKAGTTSLVDLLSQHPDIYTSPIKEPNYFVESLPEILYEPSRFFNIENYFKDDFPDSLHIANVKKPAHYQQLFSLATKQQYLLEASTMYLQAPGVPEKIAAYNPDATIIIITRDPLKRSMSHYKMLVGLSRETRSFEEVIVDDLKAYREHKLNWYSYLGMSFYTQPIKEYKKHFKKVLVISFEDMIGHQEATLRKITSFLTIQSLAPTKVIHTNTTRTLRFKWLLFLLKKIGLKDYFSAIFGSDFKQKVFQLISKKQAKPVEISEKTKQQLIQVFKEESQL